MHQASPPLADRPTTSVHSRAPEATSPEALQCVGTAMRMKSAPSDRPRRGVAQTSAEAFHSLPVAGYLQPKERAVMALFTGPEVTYTRERLAIVLGWKEAAVCGRANSLVTKGQLEEIEGGKTVSGRSAKLLRLPQHIQRSLL